jgi:tetratricopeptide (TPR) repeat protein
MKRRTSVPLLFCVLLAHHSFASIPPVTNWEGTPDWLDSTVRSMVDQADRLVLDRADEKNLRLALDLYRKADTASQNRVPQILWRHSMACYFVGITSTASEDKEAIYGEGRDKGDVAVALAPDCTPCLFWSAIDSALHAQTVGTLKVLFKLSTLRERLERVVSLNPGYAGAGALRLLGIIEQNLPGIFGGSNDRARAYFEKAIDTAPGEPLNYLFLARLLDEKFDKKREALEIVKRGLTVSERDEKRPEAIAAVKDLEAMAKLETVH